MRYIGSALAIFLILLIVTTHSATAQVPPSPQNLTVQPAPGATGALLQWQPSPGAMHYKVYKAVDSSNHFMRIGTTSMTSFIDWMVFPGHIYHYYVTASNMSGESGPSNMVTFTPSPPPPHVSGWMSGTVTDDSTNLAIVGARVVFFVNPMGGMPSRMAFTDSLGAYMVEIDTGTYYIFAHRMGYVGEWYDDSPSPMTATPVPVAEGDTSVADFGLSPLTPPPPHVQGTLAGTVIDDSTGLPIPRVRVRLYRLSGFMCSREARTDSSGMYSVDVDTGRYLVYATKFGYRPEWYDNSPTREGATPVTVPENGTATADFGLAPAMPSMITVNVSGTVTDSATGLPIAHALVAILRTFETLNLIGSMNGMPGGFGNEMIDMPGFGRMHGVVWWGHTNASGQYTGHVPAGHTYIVFSGAMGYIPEFFNNKHSPIEADRLTLYHDTTGIDFALSPNAMLQNSIAGRVMDSALTGIASHVVLFRVTPFGPHAVRHAMTDSIGDYRFQFVRPGPYFLKALPIAGYAPAWYKAGAFGVTDWHDADTVMANGDVTGIDIGVVPLIPGGFAEISGRVMDNSGLPVGGALVYAITHGSNGVVAYTISDNAGMYSLGELAPGTFSVVVDKAGYGSVGTWSFEVSPANNYRATGADITVIPENPASSDPGVSGLPSNFALEQNFPNPFNPSTEIRFSVPTPSSMTLEVYNMIGQRIITLVDREFAAGVYSVSWSGMDASGRALSSGVYFCRLTAVPASVRETPHVEIRKMLLLK